MKILKSTRIETSPHSRGNVCRAISDFPIGTQVWVDLEGTPYCIDILVHDQVHNTVLCKVCRRGDVIVDALDAILVDGSALAEVDMGG